MKEVCGDYPAVYGGDLGDIHKVANLDGVNFELMKGWFKEVYVRRLIITISMHLDNPVSGGNAWDNYPAVGLRLSDSTHHGGYLKTLDLIEGFYKIL